jgi:glycosyltransferase involved in cell wall biosynthesis
MDKNLIRILVWPNITNWKNRNIKHLEQDSYIQVIKNQIKVLNEIRDDLFFYLVLPQIVPSLRFDNATPLITNISPERHLKDYNKKELKELLDGHKFDIPTYAPTMRSHFDVEFIRKLLSTDLDFDLVMSHLPEHTHNLKNTLYNTTHHTPLFFGYCHWFDIKGVVKTNKDSFLQNMIGLLEYDRCYINTHYQKKLVLEQAKQTFNDTTINKLDEILKVQHLGVNETDITDDINETPGKVIVFNHRPDTYKHFNSFMNVMEKLREQRQDFRVWVPLLSKSNRKWVITDNGDGSKEWYYKQLQNCCVGFSPKQKYGGWSVATTDGLMNGVPFIMYDEDYYKELCSVSDFYTTDDDTLCLLNKYLDDTEYRNQMARESLEHIKNKLIYKNEMVLMSNYIDELLSKSKATSVNSKSMTKIIKLIKDNSNGISKKELFTHLNWGRGIKFSPYRRALMKHKNIYDVGRKTPLYIWKN